MTEGYEDLMYRAGMTAQGCWDEMDSYQRAAIETFGMLIVEECKRIVALHQQRLDSGPMIIVADIERYFNE